MRTDEADHLCIHPNSFVGTRPIFGGVRNDLGVIYLTSHASIRSNTDVKGFSPPNDTNAGDKQMPAFQQIVAKYRAIAGPARGRSGRAPDRETGMISIGSIAHCARSANFQPLLSGHLNTPRPAVKGIVSS